MLDGKSGLWHHMKEGDGCSIWNLFCQGDRVYSFQMYVHSQNAIINDLLQRHFSRKPQSSSISLKHKYPEHEKKTWRDK